LKISEFYVRGTVPVRFQKGYVRDTVPLRFQNVMCVTEEEQNGTCYKAEDCTEKGGKAKVIIIIIIFIIN
jgi:hypothetical protein